MQSCQIPDVGARLLLGGTQVIKRLQVEPELRACSEEMCQAQRRVAGHGALTVEDLGDAVGRHLELAAERGSTNPEHLKLLGKMFPGMNGSASHHACPQ